MNKCEPGQDGNVAAISFLFMCDGFFGGENMHDDIYFMKEALKEAKKSYLLDEVPVGAIIVKDDKIIARGHNLREKSNDPTAHAEILAIKKACHKLKSWRLVGCKIYVTLEPCSMCAGAILWTRIQEIVFATSDLKGGALGTCFNLFDQKGLNHYPKIKAGILKEESAQILSQFFKNKRKKE